MKKILITGAFGQIGSELVPALQKRFGEDNVVALAHRTRHDAFDGIIETGDVTDADAIEAIIKSIISIPFTILRLCFRRLAKKTRSLRGM